ncbi:MAG: hypothetical protein U1E56_07275 [Bauldia sp.]
MRDLRGVLAALTVVISAALSAEPAAAAGPRYGHVYLLTGLANVFSVGMDTLGEELTARGVPNTVRNHLLAHLNVDQIVADYHGGKINQPIAIIGHSFGGDAAVWLAEQLNAAHVPVRLLVVFDATAAVRVPANVSEAINFYLSPGGTGVPLQGGPGFRGVIRNRNLSGTPDIIHTNIDKSAALHKTVIAEVLRTLRRG